MRYKKCSKSNEAPLWHNERWISLSKRAGIVDHTSAGTYNTKEPK